MWKTALGRVRLIGFAEGASFLLLMGIAMPLKYFAGFPEAVQVVGMAHGILFIVYLIAIAWALVVGQLSFVLAFFGVIASFLPAGPFVYDYFLPKRTDRGARFPTCRNNGTSGNVPHVEPQE